MYSNIKRDESHFFIVFTFHFFCDSFLNKVRIGNNNSPVRSYFLDEMNGMVLSFFRIPKSFKIVNKPVSTSVGLLFYLTDFYLTIGVFIFCERCCATYNFMKREQSVFFWINQEVNVNLLVCSTCFNKIFIKAFINKPTYSRCWLCICTLIFVIMFEEQLQHKVIV